MASPYSCDPTGATDIAAALEQIKANQSNVGTIHIPKGTFKLSTAFTLPVGMTLRFEAGSTLAISADVTINGRLEMLSGGLITIATTKTLTINGGFEAGLYHCLTCAGTGTVVFGDKVPAVYPQWTGALGDNSTDDSTAINLAADIARASVCKRIILPPCTGYAATSQLDLRELNVEGKATILTDYAGAGILVGDANNLDIELSVNRPEDGHEWDAGMVGIQVSGTSRSNMTLAASNQEVGIKFLAGDGSAGSSAYNTITLKGVQYNEIGFMVHVPAAATGWCNENLVIGGNFANTREGAECAIKLLSEGTYSIDKWTFIKPSLEYVYADQAIIFTKTQNCYFWDVRMECEGDIPVAKFNDRSYNNVVSLGSFSHLGYEPYTWDVADSAASPYGTTGNDVRMSGDYTLHRLTDAASFNSAYHDGTYLHVPGFAIIDPTDGTVSRKSTTINFALIDGHDGAALAVTDDAYETIGIKVNFYDAMPNNATPAKKLYIKHRLLDNDQQTRLFIRCFDSDGNVLSGSDPPYVQGNQWSAIETYYRILGSNTTQAIIFHVDVASALIGVAGNSTKYTGLEIYSPYMADGYLPYTGPKELPGHLLAANSPTKWHFQVGDRVLNDTPATEQPQGWACTKRTETTLAADGEGTDSTIEVASITNIASGDVIGVKLDTGKYHFTTVNGAPSGTTVTLTAALPGAGVVATSGNAVVANLWAAMPDF